MNKEMINLIEDLKELGENRVPVNINSLLNSIKLCGYNYINANDTDDTRIGIFENNEVWLTANRLIGILHYKKINDNDILITGFTHCPYYDFIIY